jgi:hypothetical protein
MNAGKTLFAQIMEFVPWKTFGRIVARHHGDAGTRKLSSTELFRILAFSQLTWRESLRDIEACLAANSPKLFHMGLRSAPARSTLADALNSRDWRIYQALALQLIAHARRLYAEERVLSDLDAAVYALDSTTIDLCLSLFDWAPFRTTKAAIKLHTLLDLRGAIPSFIHIWNGKMHDVRVLDLLPVEAGSIYVMDRGYIDYRRLFALHQAGAFFVTRARETMDARRVYSLPADRTRGIVCDQRVRLNGFYAGKHYPEHLRRIRYRQPETDRTFVFLTNNTALDAATICALYKCRWQVELFFKWIKQHLRIKRFLGTSENAVKTQIWAAISTYVLIAIMKKELGIEASLYTFLQILSVSIFEKTPILCALGESLDATEDGISANQMILFDF